jgi:DNA polymerase-1
LLVDGHAYAYRAFHAIRQLSAPDGSATNAIYGFVKMLGKMRERFRPGHAAVVWDAGLARERLELLPAYKAQRPPMPDSLERQIEGIKHWLGASGIASVEMEGTEADDLIASLARDAAAGGHFVVIASSDKDFMQCVTDHVGILNPNDKSEVVWSDAEVVAKTGVRPLQIVEWLSLLGDAVDNIDGVKGVGAKTAADLLQRFGTVENVYQRLTEVNSARLRGSLELARDVVTRNARLIRLDDRVPGAPDLARLALGGEDHVRLAGLYRQWGFRSLLSALPGHGGENMELFSARSPGSAPPE